MVEYPRYWHLSDLARVVVANPNRPASMNWNGATNCPEARRGWAVADLRAHYLEARDEDYLLARQQFEKDSLKRWKGLIR